MRFKPIGKQIDIFRFLFAIVNQILSPAQGWSFSLRWLVHADSRPLRAPSDQL